MHARKVLIATLLLALAACGTSPRTRPLAASAAAAGLAVTQSTDRLYLELGRLDEHEWRGVRTSDLLAMPAAMPVPTESYTELIAPPAAETQRRARLAGAVAARRAAVAALADAYAAFAALAAAKPGADTAAAVRAVAKASEKLAAAAAAPIETGGAAGPAAGLTEALIDAAQARELRAQNRALAALAGRLRALWQADAPLWRARIDAAYNPLALGLIGLPDSAYDDMALAAVVSEPVAPALRRRLYRAQVARALAADKAALGARLDQIDAALAALEASHAALAADRPVAGDALGLIEQAVARAEEARGSK